LRKTYSHTEQEDQLMLTNLHDAFTGQTRSPNMVPFDMLDIWFSISVLY